ncbi:unnamed protein product [Echinostoma caproni]|uniref:Serine palmitoyltransferase 1 n=1 Tax=Echinostoma caproni TaxID=27848 RepID=A0A183ACZ9_9TREM|nr:unnamed protein product [Echinostoma caproni]
MLGLSRNYWTIDATKLKARGVELIISEFVSVPFSLHFPPRYVSFESADSHPTSGDHPKQTVRRHLNFASFNFLNFVGDTDLSEAAVRQMKEYGVGACGPRGFYGTFDVHLNLEDKISKFLRVEKSVVYSYGAATFSSAIPSYAKRTDVIFADEGIGHAAFQGIVASRSRAYFFRHNDMEHLKELLLNQAARDREDPQRAMLTRRFLVVEGLYANYGDICPLPELVKLKYQYKVRILLDESHSFGVLGATGRGVTEYFGIDVEDIDMISGSLENALGVCGGFCAGTKYVVGHQELSGQGYCFSASLPPMLATAATKALEKLEMPSERGARNRRLLHLSRLTHRLFHEETSLSTQWELTGSEDSPIKHLRLRADNSLDALECITQKAFEWYAFTIDSHVPPPSIRLTLNCDVTEDEIRHLFHVLTAITPN